ncbi:hypothetical protein TrST_g1372 [Triparma strigata]|uniref:GP-PDE domain-containing protein n=1 Tax=Triparma strigata TaxID=1606541 RepID=A0A9W7E7S9_9STRA|nr:hypothetical protein TrST_g1372 [Triparma strigata]
MVISHGDCPCLPEPANSLLWFEYAAGLGVDALEMDLMLTADGEIITFHDKSWENLSNGTGSVRETTVSYMEKHIDVSGSYSKYDGMIISPPLLEEVLSTFSGNPEIRFNMEIKTELEDRVLVAETLCRTLRNHDVIGRTLVASFDTENLDAVRKECGNELATSSSEAETRSALVPIILGLDLWAWWPNKKPNGEISVMQLPVEGGGFRLTEKKIIDRLHGHGVAVMYWVINDRETMLELIANGADGIITDEVETLREVMAEAGKAPPPFSQ